MAGESKGAEATAAPRRRSGAVERDAELAQRLRDNLKRRKLQARARAAAADTAAGPASGGAAGGHERQPPD